MALEQTKAPVAQAEHADVPEKNPTDVHPVTQVAVVLEHT